MSTTHEEYTTRVDNEDWPGRVSVPLPEPFVNDAGVIQNLLLKKVQSIAAITSKRGSVRAQHYHREDFHYAYVASGRVLYFERSVGATSIPKPMEFGPGEMFFTPPMVEHAMLFAEDSLILTFAKRVRSHEEHEKDVVRVPFLTPEIVSEYVR